MLTEHPLSRPCQAQELKGSTLSSTCIHKQQLTNVGQHTELHPRCIHLHRKQDYSWGDALDCGDRSLTSQADWPAVCLGGAGHFSHLSHAHESSSCLSLVSLLLLLLFPCIAPGFAKSILKFPKATSVVWALQSYWYSFLDSADLVTLFSPKRPWYSPFRALWCLAIAHGALP